MELAISGMMNGLKEKYNITPERSYQEAVFDAEMVIITADFALEYPQPLLPGITKCDFELSLLVLSSRRSQTSTKVT